MRRRKGYSLFEVLVAFVIMSLVLAALIPGQSSLLSRATAQEDQILAMDFAHSVLAEFGVSRDIVPGAGTERYRDWVVEVDTRAGLSVHDFVTATVIRVTIRTTDGQELATAEAARFLP